METQATNFVLAHRKDVAALLIDVHGQGEHLNLLRPRTHIHLLDRFAGLMSQRSQLAKEVAVLRKVRAELRTGLRIHRQNLGGHTGIPLRRVGLLRRFRPA